MAALPRSKGRADGTNRSSIEPATMVASGVFNTPPELLAPI